MNLGAPGGWNTAVTGVDPRKSRWDPIAQVWKSPKRTHSSVTARRADRLLNAKSPEQAERRRKRFEKAWEREKWDQGREARRAQRKEERKAKREELANQPQYQVLGNRPISSTPHTTPPGSGVVRRSGLDLAFTQHLSLIHICRCRRLLT